MSVTPREASHCVFSVGLWCAAHLRCGKATRESRTKIQQGSGNPHVSYVSCWNQDSSGIGSSPEAGGDGGGEVKIFPFGPQVLFHGTHIPMISSFLLIWFLWISSSHLESQSPTPFFFFLCGKPLHIYLGILLHSNNSVLQKEDYWSDVMNLEL